MELTWPAATDDLGVRGLRGLARRHGPRDDDLDGVHGQRDRAVDDHSYSVVAIDGGGNRSDPVSAPVTTPDDAVAPSKPSGLTGKAQSGRAE